MKALALLLSVLCFCGSAYTIDVFPLKGWKVDSPIETFIPGKLWELINGAADGFEANGFRELKTFECAREALRFSVQIYDMAEALNAYGMYRSENPPLPESELIGAEAQFSDYLAVMLTGKYYVKVETIKGQASAENCRSLLEELCQILGGETIFPKELALLPKDHKVAQSEIFVKKDFLGQKQLGNCLLARYAAGSLAYRIFVMPNQPPEAFFKELPSTWLRKPHQEAGFVYQTELPYIGLLGITVYNGVLLGIADLKTDKDLYQVLSDLMKGK